MRPPCAADAADAADAAEGKCAGLSPTAHSSMLPLLLPSASIRPLCENASEMIACGRKVVNLHLCSGCMNRGVELSAEAAAAADEPAAADAAADEANGEREEAATAECSALCVSCAAAAFLRCDFAALLPPRALAEAAAEGAAAVPA